MTLRWNIYIIYDSAQDKLTLEAQEFIWPCSLQNLETLLMREVGRICLYFTVFEFQRFANLVISKGSLNNSFSIEVEIAKIGSETVLNLRISIGLDSIILEDLETGSKTEILILKKEGKESGWFKDRLRKYILLVLS